MDGLKNAAIAACVLMLSAGIGFSQSAGSAPIYVDAVTKASFHWCTVKAANPMLNWTWPKGAMSARLTVMGGPAATSAVINTPGAPEYEWAVSLPAEDEAECVYALKLEFYPALDCGGEALAGETLLAEGIGAVRGVDGAPFRLLKTAADDSALFSRIQQRNEVVPIPAGATSLTIDSGESQTVAGPAFFAWRDIAVGEHTVTLYGIETFVRNLSCFHAGLIIRIF
jgi:hypothetical protein